MRALQYVRRRQFTTDRLIISGRCFVDQCSLDLPQSGAVWGRRPALSGRIRNEKHTRCGAASEKANCRHDIITLQR